MRVTIEQITPMALLEFVDLPRESERQTFTYWLTCTQHLWAGMLDDHLACAWGLVPPTLLSDTALLWLHTTPLIDDHKFLFIRRSQIAVQEMLKLYPNITGLTLHDADRSRRWIEWLGGTYGKHQGKFMPFKITSAEAANGPG